MFFKIIEIYSINFVTISAAHCDRKIGEGRMKFLPSVFCGNALLEDLSVYINCDADV